MNVYSRTMPLVGGNGITSPARESGASALDRRVTWAAPDPSTMVLDPWGAPAPHAVIRTVLAPWPAPDPAMRFEMPAPVAVPGMSNLVEPFHPIDMPDLAAARSASFAAQTPLPVAPTGRPLPPPTLADAARFVHFTPAVSRADRSGVRRRVAVACAAGAGLACAAVAAAVALL